LWVEQLVAESTGKHGKGVVPITGETPDAHFGDDRIVVALNLAGEPADERVTRAREAGLPIAELEMADAESIGAEFFRWEVATAAAGMLMEINPFDEPNVQQAKDATRTLLDSYARDRRLPMPEPHGAVSGARLTLSHAAADALAGAPATEFLQLLRPPDYFALLAYLPPEDARYEEVLEKWRTEVARQTGCATMFGYGPRYLHSTGQLHKGGANNGVFVVLTAAAAADLPIEGEPFSFAVLEMAQAVGDFLSLDRTGRRALHLHLPDRDPESIRRAGAALLAVVTVWIARE
jgi:hypothetical protein